MYEDYFREYIFRTVMQWANKINKLYCGNYVLFIYETRTNLCTLASGSLNFFFNQM